MSEVPASDWTRINAAADRFERAWKAGTGPRIEQCLAEAPEAVRAALFDELLRVEIEMRLRASEQPKADEYRNRFPAYHAVIDAIFAAETMSAGRSGVTASPRATRAGRAADRSGAKAIPPELAANPDYEVIRELGAGGMGLVFLAHNHIMGRDEVLKVISRDIIESPGVLDRFHREIRAVASLQHPNIVTAYSAFHAGESLVFAMEYVEGLDLARLVSAKGPMPLGHACCFVHQAALGLQHAHEAGLVHRDIKPGNLMLTRDGRRAIVKVLDFGLAKAGFEHAALDHGAAGVAGDLTLRSDLTSAGQMMGTPGYIAPEQIVDAQKADIRADIYSLGCTLYYLLSGRPPFEGATVYEVLVAHRKAEPRSLALARPELPAELADLVARMMEKKPSRRFQEPAEVARALAPFFKTRGVARKQARPRAVRSGSAESKAGMPNSGSAPSPPVTAGQAAAVPQTLAEAARSGATWENLIEIDDDDEGPIAVPTAESAEKRPVRLVATLAGVAGLAAAVVAALLFVTVRGGRDVGEKRQTKADLAEEASRPEEITAPRNLVPEEPPARAQVLASAPAQKPVVGSPPEPPPSAPNPAAGEALVHASPPKTLVASAEKADVKKAALEPRPATFETDVYRAIRDGVRFLKSRQLADGSWPDFDKEKNTGVTNLVTLALLAAGEKPDSDGIRRALAFLRGFGPNELRSTYAIALQTMVFAAVEPERDMPRIEANARWLENAQIRSDDQRLRPGSWSYSDSRLGRPGDNSNTQYAILGLHAASEVGAAVRPEVWALARSYWEYAQNRNGSWSYTPDSSVATASMTCAGISSLVITRYRSPRSRGQELLKGRVIRDCGKSRDNRGVQAGIDWLGHHFRINENLGFGQQWKYYYLYGLERAGRLTGLRFFGEHDWYRQGALELVRSQDRQSGSWTGALIEAEPILATSFAVSFLAKGRAPILINKLRRLPSEKAAKKARSVSDWDNDPDDVRTLVDVVSRDRKSLLNWQVIDSKTATLPDLLRAPILFFNGHKSPGLTAAEIKNVREYVQAGGTLLADACCDSDEFDRGFRATMMEMFPEEDHKLRPLAGDHPIWRARHTLDPETHRIWGIQHGARTAVIYSPKDLSCYWNQAHHDPSNSAVASAVKMGQNAVEYALTHPIPPRAP